MAEVVGLAIGAVGLTGLFTACSDCLELVQLGRAYASDYELLQTQFEAQKLRFLIWGQVFGFAQTSGCDRRLEDPTIRPTILRILNNIHSLFEDEDALRRRYGMRIDTGDQQPSGRIIFRESYQRFQARIQRTQRQAPLGKKTKWAIADQRKFSQLVRVLKELIDSLDDISRSLQLLQRHDDLMVAEVESVSDPGSLRLLEQAFSDNERFSDTASRRLRLIEEGSVTATTRNTQASAIVSSGTSFYTALSQQQQPSQDGPTVEVASNLDSFVAQIPQNQRIAQDFRRLAIRSEEGKPDPLLRRRPIDTQSVGQSLQRLRESDIKHTKDVITKYRENATVQQKRMILILERLLESTPTNFVSLAPIGDDLLQLLGRIEGPQGSPYEGGVFHMQISITEDFPFSPPSCRFLTKILHPNIDASGQICIDFLEPENWRMELMYLEGILLSMCALLDQPNVDDPLVPEIAAMYIQDRSKFNDVARQYTVKYANEHMTVQPSKAVFTSTSVAGWKKTFLEDRMRTIQSRTSALIACLQPSPQLPNLPPELVSSYIQQLYELSLQLDVFNSVTYGTSRFNLGDATQYEEVENFCDACATEFSNLARDPLWNSDFPDLCKFQQNETTRGTGDPNLRKFLDATALDENESALQVMDYPTPKTNSRLIGYVPFIEVNRIKRLIQHAKWLNGDKSMVPTGTEREPFARSQYLKYSTPMGGSEETQARPNSSYRVLPRSSSDQTRI